jgi:hypothetical protein
MSAPTAFNRTPAELLGMARSLRTKAAAGAGASPGRADMMQRYANLLEAIADPVAATMTPQDFEARERRATFRLV